VTFLHTIKHRVVYHSNSPQQTVTNNYYKSVAFLGGTATDLTSTQLGDRLQRGDITCSYTTQCTGKYIMHTHSLAVRYL